jgi:hypothetical protein
MKAWLIRQPDRRHLSDWYSLELKSEAAERFRVGVALKTRGCLEDEGLEQREIHAKFIPNVLG